MYVHMYICVFHSYVYICMCTNVCSIVNYVYACVHVSPTVNYICVCIVYMCVP